MEIIKTRNILKLFKIFLLKIASTAKLGRLGKVFFERASSLNTLHKTILGSTLWEDAFFLISFKLFTPI